MTTLWVVLILIILVEISAIAILPWHLTALLLLCYVLRWLNEGQHNGLFNWPSFRALRVWRWLSPVAEPPPMLQHERCIYLMTPCASRSTLVWGAGLSPCATQVYYAMPERLFWVPLVRDLLLWSGAIAERESCMLNVLGPTLNGAVCYPLMERNEENSETTISLQLPAPWLLDMAIRESFKLCIITVQGNHLDVGVMLHANVYQTAAQLQQTLTARIRESAILALGDKVFKAR